MQANHLMMDGPVRVSSILKSSTEASVNHGLTKIIGTLGPSSRSVETIKALLDSGMTVARFDFSWHNAQYHQETIENLRKAIYQTKRLCGLMMDTIGPEVRVFNRSGSPVALEAESFVRLTPDISSSPSLSSAMEDDLVNSVVVPPSSESLKSELSLPVSYDKLAEVVSVGDSICVGTGSETAAVWLEVTATDGADVICEVKNSVTLSGHLFNARAAQTKFGTPTLSRKREIRSMLLREEDWQTRRMECMEDVKNWGKKNNIDFLSLAYTRCAEDVRTCRAYLNKLGDLSQTHIFAKIENVEGLKNFDEILKEADGIILSRANLGIDLPAEKVFLFQKWALYRCNMAGKPVVVNRVVDTMTSTPRPTRAEATDVANAVLDGADAILLGAETMRGLYPVDTVTTVKRICSEAEKVYNQRVYFKKVVNHVGEPMSQLESIVSSAVKAAIKAKASVIVVFSSSGRAARMMSKYRPPMPVLVVVIPRLSTNQLRWTFTGAFQARQCLVMRGLFPMLADPRHPAQANNMMNESILKVALDYGRVASIIKAHDRVVICQKLGDSCVVKILDVGAHF